MSLSKSYLIIITIIITIFTLPYLFIHGLSERNGKGLLHKRRRRTKNNHHIERISPFEHYGNHKLFFRRGNGIIGTTSRDLKAANKKMKKMKKKKKKKKKVFTIPTSSTQTSTNSTNSTNSTMPPSIKTGKKSSPKLIKTFKIKKKGQTNSTEVSKKGFKKGLKTQKKKKVYIPHNNNNSTLIKKMKKNKIKGKKIKTSKSPKVKKSKGPKKGKGKGKNAYYYYYTDDEGGNNSTNPVTGPPINAEGDDNVSGRETDDESNLSDDENKIDEFRDEDDVTPEEEGDGEEVEAVDEDIGNNLDENGQYYDGRVESQRTSPSVEISLENGDNLIEEFRHEMIEMLYEEIQPASINDLQEKYDILGDNLADFQCDQSLKTLQLGEIVHIVKTFFSESRFLINQIKVGGSVTEDDELRGVYLDDVFGISLEEIDMIEKRLIHQFRYDVEIRSVCATCNEEYDNDVSDRADYSKYCGDSAYEYDSVMSGTVFFPVEPKDDLGREHSIVEGKTFESFLYFRDFNYAYADSSSQLLSWYLPQIFVQLIAASKGFISLSFHQTGYGSSNDLTPSPLVEKAVVASTLPLFYKVKNIVAEETNGESSVGNQMSLMGYGEGGYSSIAAASAFSKQGMHPSVFAGAAPTKAIAKISPLGIFDGDKDFYYHGVFLHELLFPYLIGLPLSRNENIVPNPRTDIPSGFDDFLEEVGVDFLKLFTNSSYPSGYLNADAWYDALLIIFENESSIYEEFTNLDVMFQGFGINLDMFKMYDYFKSNNNNDPCSEADSSFESICRALRENDISTTIENANFPIRLCQSMDDELVSYHNLPNHFVNPEFVTIIETFGRHDQANLFCSLEFLNLFSVKNTS